MKQTIYIFILVLLCLSFVTVSCNLLPQVAVVTVINNSGQEVKNFAIIYEHASKEKLQKEVISSLSKNQSTTLNLELTSPSLALGIGMVTIPAEIEYYINDTKFNKNDGDDGIILSDGEFKTIITINKDGWSTERIK